MSRCLRGINAVLLVVSIPLLSSCSVESSSEGTLSFLGNSYTLRCWERECVDGQHAMLAQDYREAAKCFSKALAYAGGGARLFQTQLLLVAVDLDQKQYDSGLRICRQMNERAHSAYELSLLDLNLGKCFSGLQRFADAEKSFRSCIARNDAIKAQDEETKLLTLDALVLLIDCLRMQGKNADADNVLSQCEGLKSKLMNVVENNDKFLIALGQSQLAKTPDEAIKILLPEVEKKENQANTNEFRNAMKFLVLMYARNNDDDSSRKTMKDLLRVMNSDPFCLAGDRLRLLLYSAEDLFLSSKIELSKEMALEALRMRAAAKSHQLFDILLLLAQCDYRLHNPKEGKQYTLEAAAVAEKFTKDEKVRLERLKTFREVTGY